MKFMKLLLNDKTPLEIDSRLGWISSADSELAELLNRMFPIAPSYLPFGATEVEHAAKAFSEAGGKLVVIKYFHEPEPPGTEIVY